METPTSHKSISEGSEYNPKPVMYTAVSTTTFEIFSYFHYEYSTFHNVTRIELSGGLSGAPKLS